MSPDESIRKGPSDKSKIEIYPSDNAFVVGIKTLMNENRLTLEEAVDKSKKDAKSHKDAHLYIEAIDRAQNTIKSQQSKK